MSYQSVFTGTWNVNAKKPGEDIRSWLVPDHQPYADIYAIGLQEIVDLNAGNLLVDHKLSHPWLKTFQNTITSATGGDYTLLLSKHMVGILLAVFVKREHYEAISDSVWDTAGVGVMGVGGNKGAAAIRFTIHSTSVCIVCSHLAAHKSNVQGRNADYHNISARLRFDVKRSRKTLGVLDHDYAFWIGDLNYRLNMSDLEAVHEMIDNGKFKRLLQYDQLLVEKKLANAFVEYSEGPIAFLPTYKYQVGTNLYERRPDKKKRFPAWCDRILWKGNNLKQISYFRTEHTTSDHKPVGALFKIVAKVIVKKKQQEIYQSLVRQLDEWENEQIPKVKLSTNQIDFGKIRFDRPVKHSIVIENVGNVIAKFRFAEKMHDVEYCKPWLYVEPHIGIIPPGESQEISMVVHVTKETSSSLNANQDVLEDILIFQLDQGVDYFVTVSGEYLKSCFGCHVDFLVRVPTPVRFYTKDVFVEMPSKVLAVPKELWRIIDFVYHKGMGEKGLFIQRGIPEEIQEIMEALDTGESFRNPNPLSMAETLLCFLHNFPSPVFPPRLCEEYSELSSLTDFCRKALMKLPLSHYNIFIYVVAFFREIIKYSRSELTAESLLVSFANGLMHVEQPDLISERSTKPFTILRHFLTSNDFA